MSKESNKFFEKSKRTLGDIKGFVKNSLVDELNTQTYASLSYVPVLGAAVVFLFKRNQELSKIHAKNSVYLQIGFSFIWFIIWLLENVPLISHFLKIFQFVPFITNGVMYLSSIFFVVASCYGAWQGFQGKKWVTPYFYNFLDRYVSKYFLRKSASKVKKS